MTVHTKVNKRTARKSRKSTNPVTVAEVTAEMNATEDELLDTADLTDMSYKELQAMAKDNGLKASGTKADLIERLS